MSSSKSKQSVPTRQQNHLLMSFLLLITILSLLHPTAANKHIPFGYQSNSAISPLPPNESRRDPSSFAGAIHYDPLHHALYMTGVSYSDTFDGEDKKDLIHEVDGWDLGVPDYVPKNGDCFYGVFKLPLDRPSWEFVPGNAIQTGVTLMHSRRFGSRSSAEACSAVDILPTSVNEEGAGGYVHEFESDMGSYNQFPPTVSPRPSSSTYNPTYSPSVTGRPTITRGVVPEEVGVVPNDVVDETDVPQTEDFTTSNIARKVRIGFKHEQNFVGVIALKEVQIYDSTGTNIAIGKTATQKSDFSEDTVASKAIDGDLNTFSHTAHVGYNAWWEVDLGSSVAIDNIHVINRDCIGTEDCLTRLSYATLDLIDEEGNIVASRGFGDTSGMTELDFDFVGGEESPATTQSTPTSSPQPTAEPPSAGLYNTSPDSWYASRVRIQLSEFDGLSPLSLKEVQVRDMSGENLAAGKSATQSSDDPMFSYPASNGVDEDLDNFFETDPADTDAWWQVDLGAMYNISEIVIYNRYCITEDCLGRLSYSTVLLFDEEGDLVAEVSLGDVSTQEVISLRPTDTTPSTEVTFPASAPSDEIPSDSLLPDISNVAQKVRIQLPESAGAVQLGLREVRIFDGNEDNVVIGKVATQSSDWSWSHLASYAVDGSTDTFSDTVSEVNAWWEVDLGQLTTITGITIFNRWCHQETETDSCLGRLSGSTVSLIDDQGNIVAIRKLGDTSSELEIDLYFTLIEVEGDGLTVSPAMITGDELILPAPAPSSFASGFPTPTLEQPSADTLWFIRKIFIQLPGSEGSGPLNLKEVEVIDSLGANVAVGKTATQSTDDPSGNYPASNAVDGSMESISQTDPEEVDAWWELDLQEDYAVSEIVIYNQYCDGVDEEGLCLSRISFSTVLLFDDNGSEVAEITLGDVGGQEVIALRPTDAMSPDSPDETSTDDKPPFRARKLGTDRSQNNHSRELQQKSPMETRSVRLLIAGHTESLNFNDGYVVEDLVDGQYDQSNVYGFTQQVDIRLPLGALKDEPDFMNDFLIMNNPNANVNGLEYSLEEESLGGFVTSGVESTALLNDHLPVTWNTLYPVSLVADATSKMHYYVLILASNNAEVNNEGRDPELHEDTTIGSGANQQSWTDYADFGVPGVINPSDLFGVKGRPKYGSDYRIVMKKMAINNVDPKCISFEDYDDVNCTQFSSIEKSLSGNSYNRDTITMSQEWVQEFKPIMGEDTRPAGLIFAPSDDSNLPDLLLMVGSTAGYGSAFGTNDDASAAGSSLQRFDLDGFLMKIHATDGSFAGKDKFDVSSGAFTNMHSMRIASLPNKNDVVASICNQPARDWGPPEPVDHVYVVGSTEGLMPGLSSGLRDEGFTEYYPEEVGVNSMEAFLMKVDVATMNTVWTVQVAGINLVKELKGNAYGFGCAVTHDGINVYLTGLVKDGGVVTDFSADALKKHDNAAQGGSDVFVASYKTSDGTLNYLRQIGSTRDDTPARGNGGITVDRIGNAIIVGNTRGSLMRQRDVAEYMFGHDDKYAASDIFIMSLERDTGEYAPISEDTVPFVIPVDNSGFSPSGDASSNYGASSAASQETGSSSSAASGATIFLAILTIIFIASAVIGSVVVVYKSRKKRQARAREEYLSSNLSPHRSSIGSSKKRGLYGKPGGSVLNRFEDMNIMVEVRNSASGGWQCVYDEDALQQIEFGTSRGGGQDGVIEQSLFMEDGLQALEEIESEHMKYSINDEDEDEEEVTDEDLIQAYNEAMAIDIEPESEAVAALTRGLDMPSIGSEHHELT